jgi:hypothetical protein
MARNDTRCQSSQPADRAFACAGARTWHALAVTAVVLMGVAPAVVVAALILVEAMVSGSKPGMALRAAGQPERGSHRASAPRTLQLSAACTQLELAPCATD